MHGLLTGLGQLRPVSGPPGQAEHQRRAAAPAEARLAAGPHANRRTEALDLHRPWPKYLPEEEEGAEASSWREEVGGGICA